MWHETTYFRSWLAFCVWSIICFPFSLCLFFVVVTNIRPVWLCYGSPCHMDGLRIKLVIKILSEIHLITSQMLLTIVFFCIYFHLALHKHMERFIWFVFGRVWTWLKFDQQLFVVFWHLMAICYIMFISFTDSISISLRLNEVKWHSIICNNVLCIWLWKN